MCFKVICKQCKKFTWAGCGMHIKSALSGLKNEEICQCDPQNRLLFPVENKEKK